MKMRNNTPIEIRKKGISNAELAAQLDNMATQGSTHAHLNKTVLDAISDNAGVLQYNGSPIQGGSGSGATSMDGLSDVDVTSNVPVEGNVLIFSNGKWIPSATSPSGDILYEDWLGIEVVTADIPDVKAPILSFTPATNFLVNQTVTISSNESATIWYTVDGSNPVTSGTRVQYTIPFTLTGTTTVNAYAIDASNNVSTVQSVTYTKLPTILYDSFTKADNTTSLGIAETGQTWSVLPSNATFGIRNGKAYCSNFASSYAASYATVTQLNYKVEVTIANPSDGQYIQVFGRYVDNGNWVAIRQEGGFIKLQKRVSSTMTVLGQITNTLVAGDIIKLECYSDGRLVAYINDILITDVVDTTHLTASNKAGFGGYNILNTDFDNVTIMEIL